MKTTFNHVQFNIDPANYSWYRDLFSFLGWDTLASGDDYFGIGDGHGSLWFLPAGNQTSGDQDGFGFNHLGVQAETQADVDAAAGYLRERNVELLYDTPCHRPEYAESEAHTYYSAMFHSPDKILFEVVYTGSKQM